MFPDKLTVPADAPLALKVEGLVVPDWVEDLSFDVRAGEVLGFAGLVGAGRTEVFEAIIGLRKRTAGRIEIAGRRADLTSPRDAMRHGLTYLSEDRKGKGLHVNLSLQDNLTLMTLERYAHPLLDLKAERAALTKAVRRIRHPHRRPVEPRAHALRRQSAEARARQVPAARPERDRARRADPRRRRRRETRHLFPDSSARRARAAR